HPNHEPASAGTGHSRAAHRVLSPFGQAVTYALNNWKALVRYTEAGILAIGRVERWRGGVGEPCVLPTLSVVRARVSHLAPFPPPARRTGSALPNASIVTSVRACFSKNAGEQHTASIFCS